MRGIKELVVGLSGATGVEIAQHVEIPTSTETKDIVSMIIQLAIGIVTLLKLFKKNKPVKE